MSVQLVEIEKSTRGKNPRMLKFMGIGKYIPRTKKVTENDVEKEVPVLDENDEPILDLITEGQVTNVEDAIGLLNGDTQKFLNQWARGYNEDAYRAEADKDELDEALSAVNFTGTTEEIESKRDAFKRAIRALAKALNLDLPVAAAVVIKNQKQVVTE